MKILQLEITHGNDFSIRVSQSFELVELANQAAREKQLQYLVVEQHFSAGAY